MKQIVSSLITIIIVLFIIPVNTYAAQTVLDKCGLSGLNCCDTTVDVNTVSGNADTFIPFPTDLKSWILGKAYKLLQEDNFGDGQCFGSNPTLDSNGICKCDGIPSQQNYLPLTTYCQMYLQGAERDSCNECVIQHNGFYTGLACVPLSLSSFVKDWVLSIMIGFAGVFALLNIIYAAFQLQVSRGNPDKIKAARERITASLVGILVIIFSIFILRFVGVNLFNLPGFNK